MLLKQCTRCTDAKQGKSAGRARCPPTTASSPPTSFHRLGAEVETRVGGGRVGPQGQTGPRRLQPAAGPPAARATTSPGPPPPGPLTIPASRREPPTPAQHLPRRRTSGSSSPNPTTTDDSERSLNAQAPRGACREGGRSGGARDQRASQAAPARYSAPSGRPVSAAWSPARAGAVRLVCHDTVRICPRRGTVSAETGKVLDKEGELVYPKKGVFYLLS